MIAIGLSAEGTIQETQSKMLEHPKRLLTQKSISPKNSLPPELIGAVKKRKTDEATTLFQPMIIDK